MRGETTRGSCYLALLYSSHLPFLPLFPPPPLFSLAEIRPMFLGLTLLISKIEAVIARKGTWLPHLV